MAGTGLSSSAPERLTLQRLSTVPLNVSHCKAGQVKGALCCDMDFGQSPEVVPLF